MQTLCMQRPSTDYIFDITKKNDTSDILRYLQENGVVVVRGAVTPEQIESLDKATKDIISRPAISGSIGYYQKDPYKKIYDALLMGCDAVDVVVSERVVALCEAYMNDECLISEIFMKHDLGMEEVYFPYHAHNGHERIDNGGRSIFGVGAIYYAHDTDEGAFCYSLGTQKLEFPHGEALMDYPKEMRDEILRGMCRIGGKAGDIVLFDERGFHGPEQPTTKSRTVLIYGYQAKRAFGNTLRSPIPVLLNDLGHLSPKQLNVLGLGASSRKDIRRYHIHGFERTRHYPVLARKLDKMFERDRKWAKRRKIIKSLLGR